MVNRRQKSHTHSIHYRQKIRNCDMWQKEKNRVENVSFSIREKNISRIDPFYNSIFVCVYGDCVQSICDFESNTKPTNQPS